ncbi:MAG: tRNA (adenosine(37)-N6)-threonylcarbamoyltransferase complex transferase subunit TsaD [Verrucomicrobia bacterium]|nr:tRNA (adenosine(37)-N6)-threonylcarbamoyltransferase complex transferase subunit TsaD [Verrucomicrobiota bacterium]
MTILALETSCDESAAAILRGDTHPPTLLASLISSQIDLHRAYGGVVPEIASRNHALRLHPLVEQTLAAADLRIDQIDAFAATRGPGLASSLLVGHSMAKALALASGKPFLSVNHMEGHLLSPFLDSNSPPPPHLALIVSGGHTLLIHVRGIGNYAVVGRSIDDAAGEAFDKVARLLGLPYPGGPEIERLAPHGDPSAFPFPRSTPGNFDFSFSGLKTAVLYTLQKLDDPTRHTADLAASFQAAVFDVLCSRTLAAARETGVNLVSLSGGVSCNKALRSALQSACADAALDFRPCTPALSTDNAAMIVFAAWLHLRQGHRSLLTEDIDPNLLLVPAT